MSILEFPRIHCFGLLQANMATANNTWVRQDGANMLCDPVDVSLRTNISIEELKAWMQQRKVPGGMPNSYWNYAGDLGIWFDNTNVRTTQPDHQSTIADHTVDELVGAEVKLDGHKVGDVPVTAKMVDVNPFNQFTTQVFAGSLSVKADNKVLFRASKPSVSHSYFVTFWRNLKATRDFGASACFQFSFPHNEIEISEDSASPVLKKFKEHVARGNGAALRVCTYMLGSGLPEGEIDTSSRNLRPLLFVGTIAPVSDEQSDWYISNRLIEPNFDAPLLIPRELTTPRDPRGIAGDPSRQYFIGPTSAQYDSARSLLSLDFSSTIPEREYYDMSSCWNGELPEKMDLGAIKLSVVSESGEHCDLAEIGFEQYRTQSYVSTGGIIDVPVDPAFADWILAGDLVLHAPAFSSEPVAKEAPYTVVPEKRAIYLSEESSRREENSATIVLRAYKRGKPSPSLIAEVREQIDLSRGASLSELTKAPRFSPQSLDRTESSDGSMLSYPREVEFNDQGVAEITVSAIRPGLCKLLFSVPGGHQGKYQEISGFFSNFRVFPADNYEHVSDDELLEKYSVIYDAVFSYYDVLFPQMSRVIDLSNQLDMQTAAHLIELRTDRRFFESSLYMPVTRELSFGKERLVQRWANLSQS